MKICDLVTDNASRANVFDQYKIDYCCGGDVSLEEICKAQGIDLEEIVTAIESNDEKKKSSTKTGLNRLSLIELVDHIEATHHNYLKEELPFITLLLEKIVNHHGDTNSSLKQLQETFSAFSKELFSHMNKEENDLFPMIRQMDSASYKASKSPIDSVSNYITSLKKEHDVAKDFLLKIRDLTQDFTPPECACNSYRTLFKKLEELEIDMHRHVHKENHILYPKALIP